MSKAKRLLELFNVQESTPLMGLMYRDSEDGSISKDKIKMDSEVQDFVDKNKLSIDFSQRTLQGMDKQNMATILLSALYYKDIKKSITKQDYIRIVDSYLKPLVSIVYREMLELCLNILDTWEAKIKTSTKQENLTPQLDYMVKTDKLFKQQQIDTVTANVDTNTVHFMSPSDKKKFMSLTLSDLINKGKKGRFGYDTRIGKYVINYNNYSRSDSLALFIPRYYKDGSDRLVIPANDIKTSAGDGVKEKDFKNLKNLFLRLEGKPLTNIISHGAVIEPNPDY